MVPAMSWLASPYDDPELCLAFQPAFGRGDIPSLIVGEALEPSTAHTLRALATPHLVRTALPDRGRYRTVPAGALPALDEVAEELRAFATAASGFALGAAHASLDRLDRGGYALRLDDFERRAQGPLLEATLDLSAMESEPAGTVYSEGEGLSLRHLLVPQQPGLLALVVRGAHGVRCERYQSCLGGRVPVWRLRVSWTLTPL
jgi:hypothetical protein